jgi:hypothetical protein
MKMQTVELRCPYCRAPQPTASAGQHTCEFCLRGFTAIDAARARQQGADQADAWLRARVGPKGEAEVVDLASRGYIFNQRILPELRRDAARAQEGLGPWMQEALILPELARSQTNAAHPLLVHATRRRALSVLGARHPHDEVRRFAVDDVAREQLGALAAPIAALIHLINVVEAGRRAGSEGWKAVHSNLDILAQQLGPNANPHEYAGLQVERWRLLASLAGHYDDCARGQHPSSQPAALEATIMGLVRLAQVLRTCTTNPVEARATALAVEREAAGAHILLRWLRCRNRLRWTPAPSVPQMAQTLAAVLPQMGGPERGVSLLESWTELAAVARQEASICVVQDFSWSQSWAESVRRRKRLGLFGEDEEIDAIECFFVPMWIARIIYSQQRGGILGGGTEQQELALLDACATTTDKLALLSSLSPQLDAALAHPAYVSTAEIALPETTMADAQAVVRRALGQRPDLCNARFDVRSLALIPAVTVRLRTAAGTRQVTGALRGLVPTSERTRERLETGRWFFTQFSR